MTSRRRPVKGRRAQRFRPNTKRSAKARELDRAYRRRLQDPGA
jgi:hypothetical protein